MFRIFPSVGKEPGKSWPQQGDITLDNVSVRYASHLPSVLKEVTLHIRPGEKVVLLSSLLLLLLFLLLHCRKHRKKPICTNE